MNENPSGTGKKEGRGYRATLIIFMLISCGSCLLSILAHAILAQLDLQEGAVAEICIGEISDYGDPGPVNYQAVWISSPPLPRFRERLMNSTTTDKILCGAVPWSSRLPYWKMLSVHPFKVYSGD